MKENLLAHLAFETKHKGRVACGVFEATQLLKKASERLSTHLDVPKFIAEVECNHILSRSENDELSFTHEMYHDYFAALEIKNRFQIGGEPSWLEGLYAQPAWQEAMILFFGLTDDQKQFIETIYLSNPLLAARALKSWTTDNVNLRSIVAQHAMEISGVSPDGFRVLGELDDAERLRIATFQLQSLEKYHLDAFAEIIRNGAKGSVSNATALALVDALSLKEL